MQINSGVNPNYINVYLQLDFNVFHEPVIELILENYFQRLSKLFFKFGVILLYKCYTK